MGGWLCRTLGEVGRVTGSGDGGGFGESTSSRVQGRDGQLQRVEECGVRTHTENRKDCLRDLRWREV